jgi:hypothetical protein
MSEHTPPTDNTGPPPPSSSSTTGPFDDTTPPSKTGPPDADKTKILPAPIRQLNNSNWQPAAQTYVQKYCFNDNVSFDKNIGQLMLIMGGGGLAIHNLLAASDKMDVHDYAEYVDVAKHMVGGYLCEDLFNEVQYYIAIFFVQLLHNSEDPARSSKHYDNARVQIDGSRARMLGTALMASVRNSVNEGSSDMIVHQYFDIMYGSIGELSPANYLIELLAKRADLRKIAPKSPLIPTDIIIFMHLLFETTNTVTYDGASEPEMVDVIRKIRDFKCCDSDLGIDGKVKVPDVLKGAGDLLRQAERRIAARTASGHGHASRGFAGTAAAIPFVDPLAHLPYSKRSVGILLRNPDAKDGRGRTYFKGERTTKCWNCGKTGHSVYACRAEIYNNGDHYKPNPDDDERAPGASANYARYDDERAPGASANYAHNAFLKSEGATTPIAF